MQSFCDRYFESKREIQTEEYFLCSFSCGGVYGFSVKETFQQNIKICISRSEIPFTWGAYQYKEAIFMV